MRRCAAGAKTALESLPQIWPPEATSASAAALGQIKICGDGVSLKVRKIHSREQDIVVSLLLHISKCALG